MRASLPRSGPRAGWSSAARHSASACLKAATASGERRDLVADRRQHVAGDVERPVLGLDLVEVDDPGAVLDVLERLRTQSTICSACSGSRKFWARPLRKRLEASMTSTLPLRSAGFVRRRTTTAGARPVP